MSSFRWLHLTDLHCGQFGQRHLWPNIRDQFFEDLEKLVVLCGPWDAVLFSGDLVQHGGALEFEQLEQQVLGPLWERFAQLGCQPVLLTVPGNHDLQRPGNKIEKSLQPALKWLLKPEQFSDIADAFFDDPDSGYRQITDMALANYVKWAADQRHRQKHPIATSSFPGDFSTTFHVSDKYRVGVLGLNSTFLQLDAGDYQGKLAWDVRQFHAVCEGDGPNWAARHDVCLLMTHQGPEWFNDASRKKVYPEINPAGRFAVHQFGHMHAEEMLGRTFAGGPLQRLWQGPSLFGLKHYGHQHNEERRHGYSACSLNHAPALAAKGRSGQRQWLAFRSGHRGLYPHRRSHAAGNHPSADTVAEGIVAIERIAATHRDRERPHAAAARGMAHAHAAAVEETLVRRQFSERTAVYRDAEPEAVAGIGSAGAISESAVFSCGTRTALRDTR